MSTEQAPQPRRVVVAMDDAVSAAPALDAAIRLAAALDARLTALFLENPDLLRAAELPFLTETGAFSGDVRPLAAQTLRRALRSGADQARAAVAAAAQGSGLTWQFDVVRGRWPAFADLLRHALDLLVFPQVPAQAPGGRLWELARLAPSGAPGPVAVALRHPSGAETALHAASTLSAALEAPLLFLTCGSEACVRRVWQGSVPGLREGDSLVGHATLPEWSADAIAAVARRHRARLLVCQDADLARDQPRLEALLSRLRCPLIVAA